MKKLLSLLLVVVTLLSVGAFASCAGEKGFDYRNEDLTGYITLGDYGKGLAATIAKLNATITDEDVNEAIDKDLVAAKAYYKKISDATAKVLYGDTVGILYKGVKLSTLETAGLGQGYNNAEKKLADMTDEELRLHFSSLEESKVKDLTAFTGGENMTTEYDLTIGSGSFIAGFEDGLCGLSIGEKNFPLVLTFPEDYSSAELKGQRVVFFTTISYKLQLIDPRDIDFDDLLAMEYEIKLNEASSEFAEDFKDGTEEPKKGVVELSQDDEFHAALKVAFNQLAPADRYNKTFTFSAESTIQIQVYEPEYEADGTTPKVDGEGNPVTNPVKRDQVITLDYTVTVYALSNIRYFTHAEAASGEYAFADFVKALTIKEDAYESYTAYHDKRQEAMQKDRDRQIKANRLQGAFNALIAASKIDLSSDRMQGLIQAYINEVNNNIEYMTMSAQASGLGSLYEQMASYYGLTDVKEYVMYNTYGYKYSTITKQLKLDAEEFVTERLVFWQYVKTAGLEARFDADGEYEKRLPGYKDLYQSETFMEDNNLTKEAVREAMLWDYAMENLADNHVTYTEKPAKKD